VKTTFLALLAVSVALALPGLTLADETPNPALAACKAEYVQLGADGFAAKYGAHEAFGACLAAHGGAATTAPTPPQAGPEAACKAEYLQLGAAAFVSKYGAGESFGACLRARGVTAAPGSDTGPANGIAARLCGVEYKQAGADAFAAKYGIGDAAKHACLQAKTPQAQAIVTQCKQDETCIKAALGVTTGDANAPEKPKAKPHADGSTSVAAALCAAEGKTLGKDAFQAKYGKGRDGFAACVKATLAKASSIVAACKSSSASSKDAFRQCVVDALKTAGAR
jgi:hypothetical protein